MAQRFKNLAQSFRMAQILKMLNVYFLAYPIFHDG